MNASARSNAFYAPTSAISSEALSLNLGNMSSSTSLRPMVISLTEASMISSG